MPRLRSYVRARIRSDIYDFFIGVIGERARPRLALIRESEGELRAKISTTLAETKAGITGAPNSTEKEPKGKRTRKPCSISYGL